MDFGYVIASDEYGRIIIFENDSACSRKRKIGIQYIPVICMIKKNFVFKDILNDFVINFYSSAEYSVN